MILELNCSIIAACLPCYGPLFKGGRKPESLIRSVRSVFSLRSRNSSKYSQTRDTTVTLHSTPASESQIELNTASREWSRVQNHNDGRVLVSAAHPSQQADEEMGPYRGKGISVTKGVEVVRN